MEEETNIENSQDTQYWDDYFTEVYENQIDDYLRG